MSDVRERLELVKKRIANAAERSGRAAQDIALVAVTKGVPAESVRLAQETGLLLFGENRIQEAGQKVPGIQAPGLEWHMVGHLQSNKIKQALGLFQLIQSVDSVRLAKEISQEALAVQKVMPVFLEVNISGAPQRFGFTPEAIYGAVDKISGLEGVRVRGLMGIAPYPATADAVRDAFRKLRNIFSVCRGLKRENFEMKYLSMGMSDDFETAIEEGSNMVRIGRAIFFGTKHK